MEPFNGLIKPTDRHLSGPRSVHWLPPGPLWTWKPATGLWWRWLKQQTVRWLGPTSWTQAPGHKKKNHVSLHNGINFYSQLKGVTLSILTCVLLVVVMIVVGLLACNWLCSSCFCMRTNCSWCCWYCSAVSTGQKTRVGKNGANASRQDTYWYQISFNG